MTFHYATIMITEEIAKPGAFSKLFNPHNRQRERVALPAEKSLSRCVVLISILPY